MTTVPIKQGSLAAWVMFGGASSVAEPRAVLIADPNFLMAGYRKPIGQN
jgi:hypothetical protein